MLRLIIRLIGYGLIAVGFANLIVDGTASLGIGALKFTELGHIVESITPKTFIALQGYIQNPDFSNFLKQILVFILGIPAVLLFLTTGLILLIKARRPKADIGFLPMK
jgi:hypothetical protein